MPEEAKTTILEVESQEEAMNLFGHKDENLKFIEKETGVRFVYRGGKISLSGPRSAEVGQALERLLEQVRRGGRIARSDVRYALMLLEEDVHENSGEPAIRLMDGSGNLIKPRSPAQKVYIDALSKSGFVFAVGPAGTGKTYLAVAVALRKLLDESVRRIIICRPAVEAGEKLGFLPGDFQQKVDPYLRPIYDALFSMLKFDRCARYMEKGVIEVAPLAYMRGRTLDDAFVILDEAQNTTVTQMKMFLTRLGRNSSAAVTGDVTQIDLPHDTVSGLVDATNRLKEINDIRFIFFSRRDVVRHELVSKIIEAYEGKENGSQ